MCGIVGIVNWNSNPVSKSLLESMTTALSHRGPNGSGMRTRDFVGLGHRRLSIIDLETGGQPMSNQANTLWLTYNGEIYNYLELREQLSKKGHIFKTRSDTEVIINAYQEWGVECLTRFRGMFAFAIADFKSRHLFLARDHFGIKPLYYLCTKIGFAFASEIYPLLSFPGFEEALDFEAMDEFLQFQYIMPPKSIFKEIRKLPPASSLRISFNGTTPSISTYWKWMFKPEKSLTPKEWEDGSEAILKESVASHLVSDVPFGAFLSGGIDSSLVVTYMSELLNHPVKTFSIGFQEQDYNELSFAEIVSKKCGTEHHVEILKSDALNILPDLVRHYGEPFGDSSAIPTYYLSKLARQHVPMVLSGDGGDEFFAGYRNYENWIRWLNHEDLDTWGKWARSGIKSLLYPDRFPFKRKPCVDQWSRFTECFSRKERLSLWKREYHSLIRAKPNPLADLFQETSEFDLCKKAQYLDIHSYLPHDILTKVDRASMMHGLEVRTPLVDVKVAEWAATIPSSQNMQRDKHGNWEGKQLLKKLAAKMYSSSFAHRPKQGFSIPLHHWFSSTKEGWKTFLKTRCFSKDTPLLTYFEPSALERVFRQGSPERLWNLLVLDEWLRQHKNRAKLPNEPNS